MMTHLTVRDYRYDFFFFSVRRDTSEVVLVIYKLVVVT